MSLRNATSGTAETAGAAFGRVLRRSRDTAGFSAQDLASSIPCDRSQVTKVEAGTRVPTRAFTEQCDKLLGTGSLLTDMWDDINWYPPVADHPDWFRQRAAMDAIAMSIQEYQIGVVPGLLQTSDYARALFSQVANPESVEERLSARLSRQQRFLEQNRGEEDAPLYVAVLDESALRRVVGGAEVMKGQLDHLLTAGGLPNIRIQVAPHSFAHLVPPNTSMSLLTLPDGHQWVYSESLGRGHLSDDPTIIARHHRTYDLLRADTLSARDSAAWIREARKGHSNHDDNPRPERSSLAEELVQRQRWRKLHRSSPRIHHRSRPRP